MAVAPRNRYLADSTYAVGHTNPAQQDSTPVASLTAPGSRVRYEPVGPGHFGSYVSGRYPDGRRVVWSNGGTNVVKLDEATFHVLATLPLAGTTQWTPAQADDYVHQLDTTTGSDRLGIATKLAVEVLRKISGVYALLDRDNQLYVTTDRGFVVYGDAVKDDPDSAIVVKRRYDLPADATGPVVGLNMTYDGRVALVTEDGWVAVVTRDVRATVTRQLPGGEGGKAAAYSASQRDKGLVGYGWVRNSMAIDDAGGIYVASNDRLHKLVWNGRALSVAWSEPYRNGRGLGTGATPVLMGFGDEDRFVVLTDGDDLMNVTLYWRDAIPAGWHQLAGAPSRRVAGFVPANMGDPTRTAIQSEQAVVVAGYGALVVNNEPASVPAGFPGGRARALLVSYLGDDPAFTPHGMQKVAWEPSTRRLRTAWVNKDMSSPNAVPYVSTGSSTAYTIGVRDRKWTLEGVDWATGRPRFSWSLGGARYNSLFSGVQVDRRGRIVYGTMWGIARLEGATHP